MNTSHVLPPAVPVPPAPPPAVPVPPAPPPAVPAPTAQKGTPGNPLLVPIIEQAFQGSEKKLFIRLPDSELDQYQVCVRTDSVGGRYYTRCNFVRGRLAALMELPTTRRYSPGLRRTELPSASTLSDISVAVSSYFDPGSPQEMKHFRFIFSPEKDRAFDVVPKALSMLDTLPAAVKALIQNTPGGNITRQVLISCVKRIPPEGVNTTDQWKQWLETIPAAGNAGAIPVQILIPKDAPESVLQELKEIFPNWETLVESNQTTIMQPEPQPASTPTEEPEPRADEVDEDHEIEVRFSFMGREIEEVRAIRTNSVKFVVDLDIPMSVIAQGEDAIERYIRTNGSPEYSETISYGALGDEESADSDFRYDWEDIEVEEIDGDMATNSGLESLVEYAEQQFPNFMENHA